MKPTAKLPDFVDILRMMAQPPQDENASDPMIDRTERLYLRIPKYDKDMLRRFARRMGMSSQTLAITILRYYINAQLK